MSVLLIPSFLVSNMSESLRSLTKNERCEQIAQIAHQKWATMSDSLTLLRGNERSRANRSGHSPKMSKWVNRSFFWGNHSSAHFWAKNKWFAQKTDERILSPALLLHNLPSATHPPLPSAKRFFIAVRQCYLEMKTIKQPYFSILSSIILWLYAKAGGW